VNLADIIARSTGQKSPLLITKMQLKLKRAIMGIIVLKECEQQSRNLHQPLEPWSHLFSFPSLLEVNIEENFE
jgi:hypothetical protein